MKKLLLFAGLCMMAVAAYAQNPFAYGLKASDVNDGKVTFSYTLNAAAESVVINFIPANGKGEGDSFEVTGDGLTAGAHEVEVPVDGLAGGEYTWAMTVKGAIVEAPVKVGPTETYWSPYGIAIDKNPQSANFGRILVTESQASVNGKTSTYWTSNQLEGVGPGIYAYDPQMNRIKNANDKYGFDGGIGFQNYSYADVTGGYGSMFGPKKVRISDDGRIFVGSLDVQNAPMYEVNPDNLNEWTPFFQGEQSMTEAAMPSWNLFTEDGDLVAGYSAAFDLRGEGADLRMVNHSCSRGQVFTYSAYQTFEYPIGTATSWSQAAAMDDEVFPLGFQWTISAQTVNVAYDQDGNIWWCQYRGSPSAAQPSIKHLSKNADNEWEVDYSDTTNMVRGGCAFDKDFNLLAMAASTGHLKFYQVVPGETGPELEMLCEYNGSGVINGFNDICFDYAGNCFVCDNSKEVFIQIQVPTYDFNTNGKSPAIKAPETVTPAPASETFTVGETPVEAKYYVCGGFNDWNANEPLEITEEGATFDVVEDPEDVESKEFKILTNGESDWLWLGGEDANGVGYFEITDGMMTDATEITLDDAGANFRLPGSGNYTITLAKSAKAPVEGVKIVVKKNNQTPTAITDIQNRTVTSVKYVNMAGQMSSTPFEGVNVKVTTYSNGQTETVKILK
ncbi:MAG: hypothetical protein J5523_07750 [Muribaculaceae bacterium]|nr:hypothetical protein [Muribaculaceae bacterium]